jgi:tetratricopeptide (TPR) repeat protein
MRLQTMPLKPFSLRLTILATLLAVSIPVHAGEPATELTSDFIYKYLVGEVAGQRGDMLLASQLFYDLAQSSRDARMAERAARAAAYGNQQQLAMRAARLWAELDPGSMEAQQAMAQMLLSAGKLDDARPYLEKLLSAEATRAQGFLYLNSIITRHPDKDAAFKLTQELAKPYPDLAEARFALAHSAWIADKPALAVKELRVAEELLPGWEMAAMLHGEILQKQSMPDAMNFYRAFLDQYPAANDIRLVYARLLVNQKQFEAARNQFTQLAENTSGNPELAVVVGLLAGQLGDYAQANNFFMQALENGYKDSDRLYLYLGQSAEKQQRIEQAMDWYQKVQAGEHYFDAQLRIAALLAGQHKLDEARALLHGLEELDNEQQALAIQFEANLLAQAKNYQEAYELLENAINSRPNTTGLIYDYAMLAEKLQRFDIMEQQLRKLILIKPDYAQAYNALGYTLADRNERLGEAAELIEKALSLSPDDHYILDSMGWVQYRMGKLDKAAEYLRRAYSTQTDPEIAAHLGEVLWKQGKRDEAMRTWEEALREHPDNELLTNTRDKFLR